MFPVAIPDTAVTKPMVQVAEAGPVHRSQVIGTATMREDGSILDDFVIRDLASGASGMGREVYRPGEKRYAERLQALGGLKRGESKRFEYYED